MSATKKVHPSILQSFFEETTRRLNNHPDESTRVKLLRPPLQPSAIIYPKDNDGEEDPFIPISLENHRTLLMEEQLDALNKVVLNAREKITLNDVQICLRKLGSKDLSNVSCGEGEKVNENLLSQMTKMNDAARLAFVRSILWSEVAWVDHFKASGISMMDRDSGILRAGRESRNLRHSEDGLGPMEKSAIIEFCSLCSTAVRLPEVALHFKDGTNIFPKNNIEEESNSRNVTASLLPHYRVMNLQHMILRALGYDHEFGALELRNLLVKEPGREDNERDPEVEAALEEYIVAIQGAGSDATSSSLKEGLSDYHEGGVTRVTSVKFTEKNMKRDERGLGTVTINGEAPSLERMEQHDEQNQREEFEMAQKAASLQQSILTNLRSMDEEERDKQLAEAKAVHEEFVKDVMKKPAGPERVNFIQNIGLEKQKMLLIYKLWGEIQRNP